MAHPENETEDALNEATQKRCSDCGDLSPPVESQYTIISVRAGWRLTIGTDSLGRRTMIWRCPVCVARLRGRT
jgi:hypothetical protein